jgi:uncharacterized membrane protein
MLVLSEILWQSRFPRGALVALLVAAVLVLLFTTWRYQPKRLLATLLGLLRLVFLAALGWCLLLPVLRSVERERLKTRFLIALDTSGSMSLKATKATASRWETAAKILGQPWRDAVAAKAEVNLFTFDKTLSPPLPPGEAASAQPQGTSTALKDSIARLVQRYRGQPVAGVLLLSDGLDSQDSAPGWPDIEWPGPVFTVQLEPPDAWEIAGDLRVESIDTPRRVVTGWESKLTAVVGGQGTKGEMVGAQLFLDGQLLEEQPVLIPDEGGAREVSYLLQHPAPGTFNYTVRVPVLPGEVATNDNEYAVTVQVVDKRNRLLYVEGIPRWESKYLNRVLQGLRDMASISFLRGPGGKFLSYGQRGGMDLSLTADQLALFRIVVIGDLDSEALGPDRVANLRKFVETGGSLILLGGPAAWSPKGFAATGLKDMSPVKFGGVAKPSEGKFPLALTEDGRAHPAFQGEKGQWDNLPAVISLFPGAQIGPAATALVVAQTPSGEQPVLAWQRYGQGRVVAFLTDSLWRWKLNPDPRQPYDKFWTQMVTWLTPGQEQVAPYEVEVFAGTETFFLSEPVGLRARVGGTDAAAAAAAAVTCEIETPEGRKLSFPMKSQAAESAAGHTLAAYALDFKAPVAGLHRAVASAEIAGQRYASAPYSFMVRPYSPETTPRPAADETLRAASSASGGRHLQPDEVNDALSRLNISFEENEKIRYTDLWGRTPIFGLLVGLLCMEWVIRKARNMA